MPSAGARTGLADGGGDVDRVVLCRLAGEGIGAAAEAVGEDAAHGRDGRGRGEELRLRGELLLQDAEVLVQAVRAEAHLVDVVAVRVDAVSSSLRRPPEPPWLASSSVVMPAMMASLRVRSSTVRSWVRSDSTDLPNCSFARLQLVVFAAELRKLVRLREGGEVLDREERRQTERGCDERDQRKEQAVRHLQLSELGPRVRDKDDR